MCPDGESMMCIVSTAGRAEKTEEKRYYYVALLF